MRITPPTRDFAYGTSELTGRTVGLVREPGPAFAPVFFACKKTGPDQKDLAPAALAQLGGKFNRRRLR